MSIIASINVGTGPHGVCVSPNSDTAYVTNNVGNTLSIINISNYSLISTLTGFSAPDGICISLDNSKVYFSNETSNTVSVINTTTNTLDATINGLSSPHGICVSPNGTRVYVSNYSNDTVSVIDTSTNSIIYTINLASNSGPKGICILPNGNTVYVANYTNNTISAINTSTNVIISTINLASNSGPDIPSSSLDGNRVYVSNNTSNNISVINTSNNTVITTISGLSIPHGICMSPGGNTAYVTNYGNNTVSIINLSTNSIIYAINGVNQPWDVTSPSNGSILYVTNFGGNSLSVIKTTEQTITNVTGNYQYDNTITITGTHLTNTTYVSFNDNNVIPTSFTIINDTIIKAYIVHPFTIYNATVTNSIGGSYTFSLIPPFPICFPSGTPITLDQGMVTIEKVNPRFHTINGKKIVAVTKTTTPEETMVCIKKNALGKNIPSQETIITNFHKIMYNNKLIEANVLAKMVKEGINKIPYNGEPLYNILMEDHELMTVNNMLVETLNPKNLIAKLYNKSYNSSEKYKILKEIGYFNNHFNKKKASIRK